jgi:hypothetical protein
MKLHGHTHTHTHTHTPAHEEHVHKLVAEDEVARVLCGVCVPVDVLGYSGLGNRLV